MTKTNKTPEKALQNSAPTAIRTAKKILKLWNCSAEEISIILGISSQAITELENDSTKLAITKEQVIRTSYILNIYEALNLTFNNPANINGFINMSNHNHFFEGRAPKAYLLEGGLDDFARVYRHIDGLRFI